MLSNLAKAYSGQGKNDLVEGTLWHSLEVDPNQENGLLWWGAIHHEREGAVGWRRAIEMAAKVKGSWRPQLWLARAALERRDIGTAMELYRYIIQNCHPLPADVLMQITGDLGKNGCLRELVELGGPLFDPKVHGLQAGNNLLKAYIDLKDAPAARQVLEQLYAQQRPDWKSSLLFWEEEIDKLDKGYGPVPASEKIQVRMLTLDEPIWARSKSVFAELLQAKSAGTLRIGFVCGSAEQPPSPTANQMVTQPANNVGRFTRGLPLFLAEQINLQTEAQGVVLVPWLTRGGFVLSGGWNFEHLGTLEPKLDYLVFLHVVSKLEPWEARFQLMRVIDQKILSEWGRVVDMKDSTTAIQELCSRTLEQLHAEASIEIMQASPKLSPPETAWLPHYLVGLEQALAVSCAAMAPDTQQFLHAERSILDHLLEISLGQPANIRARFLLLSTVQREAKARPDVAGEYRARLEQLQSEHPLEPTAQAIAQAALASIFSSPK